MSADEDIGNYVFRAIAVAVIALVVLAVSCHAMWHHLRWAP